MTAKRKTTTGPVRRAQLVADAVAVLCPYCAEPQPNPGDGSEQWTMEDFQRLSKTPTESTRVQCVACDKPILVFSDRKVQFS